MESAILGRYAEHVLYPGEIYVEIQASVVSRVQYRIQAIQFGMRFVCVELSSNTTFHA